jgi:hypothetical protein
MLSEQRRRKRCRIENLAAISYIWNLNRYRAWSIDPDNMNVKLSKSMTAEEFVSGYWYAIEIKEFAGEIGISPVSGLRKDELESLILNFLRTGKKIAAPKRQMTSKVVSRDSQNGLYFDQPIVRYTNNRETKGFILSEAAKINPDFKQKSGAMYRLNRWREDQIGGRTSFASLVSLVSFES